MHVRLLLHQTILIDRLNRGWRAGILCNVILYYNGLVTSNRTICRLLSVERAGKRRSSLSFDDGTIIYGVPRFESKWGYPPGPPHRYL